MSRIRTHDRTGLFLLDIEKCRSVAGFSNEIERWGDFTHTHHHQRRHVAVLLFCRRDCSMPVRVCCFVHDYCCFDNNRRRGWKERALARSLSRFVSLDSRQLTRGNMNREELKIQISEKEKRKTSPLNVYSSAAVLFPFSRSWSVAIDNGLVSIDSQRKEHTKRCLQWFKFETNLRHYSFLFLLLFFCFSSVAWQVTMMLWRRERTRTRQADRQADKQKKKQ